ncbi:GNAT family N-acetyltransferase [Paenibacillus thalictri]|uniref:GNAT family N-acetyltransferase n=1 Tax=Paenibacillus thalictri TaxID=2527873 RepID=A0A4Q9DLI7_9BACL|nr:GNAT family N-acetyltransferase [Paenibacillus thalictri]TBL74605.1 GNAT family N-acetyltransferase [Paenibacillus thalictri]
MSDQLAIRRATREDLEDLQQLYIEAARWIRLSKGIRQWKEEAFTLTYIEQFVSEQDVFVAHAGDRLAGCFSIQWQYEEIWGEQFHQDAGYIHRLAVSRETKGQGLGKKMLVWAEDYIRKQGKHWIRLDCMADNPELNAYYISLGMIYRGRFNGRGWSANLYEREIMK